MKLEYDIQLIKNLEQDLKEYDKVFLVLDSEYFEDKKIMQKELFNQGLVSKTLVRLCNFITIQEKQKILVLSTINLEFESKRMFMYRQITKNEAYKLYKLYHMYEFSDRFFLIGRKMNHACLLDFMDSNLLNLSELLSVLLY